MKNSITSVEVHINNTGTHPPFAVVEVYRGYNAANGFLAKRVYGLRKYRDLTRASLLRCQRAQLALMERTHA